MLFNSLGFLIFFPIVVLIYFIFPVKCKRARNFWLLVSSYYFYMCWNAKYALLLLGSTMVTYFSGLLIQKFRNAENDAEQDEKNKSGALWAKMIVVFSIVLNIGALFAFKYLDFFVQNLIKVFSKIGVEIWIEPFSILLPVGISFYIFQAMGYVVDVYRGKICAEKSFLKYAVFVSFFPQLVAGPIERSTNLLKQFEEEHYFRWENVKNNLLLMGWGFFMKMVIADRIAVFVNKVYGDYNTYGGWYIVIATILFAFQIYCDFAGYSNIAIGAAGVMGFKLMENFKSPYCAISVKDFWGRWHISLTTWFMDYLYIPLGGNRKGRIRRFVNIMIVFLVSGLWHGAMWSYVLWGGLNGIYLIAENLMNGLGDKVNRFVKREAVTNKIAKAIFTFCLVDISWFFFRTQGIESARNMILKMFEMKNFEIIFDGALYQIMDQRNFMIMLLSIVLLMIVDILHTKGISIRCWLSKQSIWFRWLTYVVMVESILVFGIWGVGYDKSAFIYFQF